ncbi:putative molecular chaperone, heat shock Hsp20 family [Methylorubrum extorquens DM4]|jgi:HSP20 family protein|uniref:Molecular chaperone, heat shock Hsp20 family n=2 Tax=Methylorubrum TaxID=2282523 RepID=C7CHE6_METED|nr:Hsp20/alpha crystallin family protein [Methylorubrum extorquens]CAX23230.1 putative molecular chaperone, heat shock Hsp20 family [Methylorubrum extorquens DM4]
MAIRDLIPWGRNESRSAVPSTRGEEAHPLLTFHREMNRLFDDVFRSFDVPSAFGRSGLAWPSVELTESDDKLKVAAEVPGMDEREVEVLLDDDALVIRGEKKAEADDKERGFSERYYGRFERVIPLPYEVEEAKVEASFKNGVLTVSLPKSPKAQSKTKRIAVNGKAAET